MHGRISPQIEHRLFSHITLNWRGRPLTSHEVVVQTIAATRTRGGLRAGAALDAGDYPAGVAISNERMAALPLDRHGTRGAWNYTLHPQRASRSAETAPAGESRGPAQRRQGMLGRLAGPRLTGLSTAQLQQPAGTLAPAQAARAQQRYSQQRGGRARRATGNPRARPLFDDAARLLLTLLYQRQVCQAREVLEDHGHHPGAAPVRFGAAQALVSFLDSDLRPARAAAIERLSHPALTGPAQDDLRELAGRQSSQAERLAYQRRGSPRQPGTRAGVFPQKISNSERVLLTILCQQGVCTLDVPAAALGDVSRSAIGNVIRETLPLLQQAGHTPGQAPTRYRTAADLLAAGETSDTATS